MLVSSGGGGGDDICTRVGCLASPLDRLSIYPEALVELHQTGRFSRVEQKAVPMLLKCIGADLREDIVTSGLLSTAAIVYKSMCKYQPGGSAEREQLLSYIIHPGNSASAHAAVKAFRKWRRWMTRSFEIGLKLPDPSLQVKGLDSL